MARKVNLIETTLRDGHQSLWAMRMTTAMMLPTLALMDRAGFGAIECKSTGATDACVRCDRMRLLASPRWVSATYRPMPITKRQATSRWAGCSHSISRPSSSMYATPSAFPS